MKLLNFSIDRGILLQIAGQTFDLHNAFVLQGYRYDLAQRTFILTLQGTVFWEETTISTDLDLVFDHVDFLRIHQDSRPTLTFTRVPDSAKADDRDIPEIIQAERGDTNLLSIQMVDELTSPTNELMLQVGELFRTDEIAEHDRKNYMLLEFTWGLSIPISAETVSAFFTQRNTLAK